MKLKKMVLAATALSTMAWSFSANATVNSELAMSMYFGGVAAIHNECVLYWTYDPDPYSNYSNCVFAGRYNYAQGAYIAAAMYLANNDQNMYDTLMAVGDAFYYYY